MNMTVTEKEAGRRLDAVLEVFMPQTGLRGRRRACEEGLVLVNGRSRPAAYKVRCGEEITLDDTPSATDRQTEARLLTPERGASCGLAAFFKPAGMHSEALAGKSDANLRDLLPSLLAKAGVEAPSLRMLNRLDCATSGIVMAALTREGEELWKAAQNSGATQKYYLALLQGRLDEEKLVKERLILKGRDRVLVEMAEHEDRRRHTLIHPLHFFPAGALPDFLRDVDGAERGVTLAGALILKGARHQIRAHASSLGHPLLGDVRYGAEGMMPEDMVSGERFWLHHGRNATPDFAAFCLPSWLSSLGAEAEAAGKLWLSGKCERRELL